MFHTLWTLIKTAVILIIAALLLVMTAYSGYIITFVIVLMIIGVLSFVILHRPEEP